MNRVYVRPMVGICDKGTVQSVFNTIEIKNSKAKKKRSVLGDRKVKRLTYWAKPLIGYVQPKLLECSSK